MHRESTKGVPKHVELFFIRYLKINIQLAIICKMYFVYTNKVIGINKIHNQGGTKDVIYERSDRELCGRLCW